MIANKIEQIKLVDGSFAQDEAKEILTKMLSFKIQFHQLKNFSHQEKFGQPEKHSLKRIAELEEELAKLKDYFSGLDGTDKISIHASIHLEEL